MSDHLVLVLAVVCVVMGCVFIFSGFPGDQSKD